MFEVVFYRTDAGSEPALDWFKSLPPGDRQIVGADLRTLQIGFPMGMPLCRSLGDGLWELRSTLPKRIARVVFFTDGGTFVVLHGFIKKSQKTPNEELDVARARKRVYALRGRSKT
jgi:phage-related protein